MAVMRSAMGDALVMVDSGGANLGSVQAALRRLGVDAPLTADAERIRAARRVILPGVGAARVAMERLIAHGLVEVLRGLRQPVLGVCVGMQLLYAHSEEGAVECLGVVPEPIRRLPEAPGIRIPHMGWNALQRCQDEPLMDGLADGEYAYFVHSYGAAVGPRTSVMCQHGSQLTAIVRAGNFVGVQFHPERSARVGAQVLANFLKSEA